MNANVTIWLDVIQNVWNGLNTNKSFRLVINCVTWLGVYVTGDNDEENWHQPEQIMLHDEPHNWIWL